MKTSQGKEVETFSGKSLAWFHLILRLLEPLSDNINRSAACVQVATARLTCRLVSLTSSITTRSGNVETNVFRVQPYYMLLYEPILLSLRRACDWELWSLEPWSALPEVSLKIRIDIMRALLNQFCFLGIIIQV